PEGKTVNSPSGDGNLDFQLLDAPSVEGDTAFGTADDDLPPLPQKLSPAQAARLAEIFDFLHRGIAAAVENVTANEDGTQVQVGFNEWQTVQAVQIFLARYLRAVADPDQQND